MEKQRWKTKKEWKKKIERRKKKGIKEDRRDEERNVETLKERTLEGREESRYR